MNFLEQPTILESDLEEYLVKEGYDVWDDPDDINDRTIDSTKVCDLAHDLGYCIDPLDHAYRGYTFIKESVAKEASGAVMNIDSRYEVRFCVIEVVDGTGLLGDIFASYKDLVENKPNADGYIAYMIIDAHTGLIPNERDFYFKDYYDSIQEALDDYNVYKSKMEVGI